MYGTCIWYTRPEVTGRLKSWQYRRLCSDSSRTPRQLETEKNAMQSNTNTVDFRYLELGFSNYAKLEASILIAFSNHNLAL